MRAILTYHSVDDSGSVVSVDRATFARHVDWLARSPVKVVSLGELVARGTDTRDDAVALTFDDGFRNFGELAWPLLRDAGLPATLFVVSELVGTTNAWEKESGAGIPVLPLLDWDALGALGADGVELGCHGRTHCRLSGLEAERLEQEVAGACAAIAERTGTTPVSFAYPFGDLDAAAEARVRASFDIACTTELGVLAGEPAHRLPRLDSFYLRPPGRLEAFGSAGFRRWLALRKTARRARSWVRNLAAGGRR